MKANDLYKLILFLPAMIACQSEEAVIRDNIGGSKHKYSVMASLPETDETRTHITYDNQDIEHELFRWHPVGKIEGTLDDYITIFNASKLSQYDKIELNVVKTNGNSAEFESAEDIDEKDFYAQRGDILFVNYWAADGKMDENGRYFFEIDKDSNPQPIVEDPYSDDYMTYMQKSLKMYDIVKVEKDGTLPDIHFKHLSGIMRVSLRNETGEAIYPKSLTFECQGEEPVFISKLCCGVDIEGGDGGSLFISDKTEYSTSVSYSTNNYTAAEGAAVGGAVAPGKTYELYVPFMPRYDNNIKANKLTITLEGRDNSSQSGYYTITLDPFGVALKAGKRYWFNLTAVKDGDNRELIFTSDLAEWLKSHPKKNPDNGDQNPSGD